MQVLSEKQITSGLAAAIKAGNNPYIPIYKLVLDGTAAMIAVFQAAKGEKLKPWAILGTKPHLIIIGDDMPPLGMSCGPSRFHVPSIVEGLKRCHGTVLQVASFVRNPEGGEIWPVAAAVFPKSYEVVP